MVDFAIPFMPLMIALLSIGLAFAFYAPFFISVAVLFFAYFKIDQLVSVLSSGRTVFMLSVLAFSAAILHIFVTRQSASLSRSRPHHHARVLYSRHNRN